jgi:RHS repeat-associated protein
MVEERASMTRFRHFAIVALALMACPVSAFAHIPRDVLEPTVSLSDICVHPSACASTTADRRPFVVLSPNASRLTRIQYHNGASNFVDRVYTLDAHGNTTAMEINAGLLPTVTPAIKRLSQNAADELTGIQTKTNPGVQDWTEKTPAHDDEGNLTTDGENTYGYDYENRLVSVVAASGSAAYYYAGDGSRVAAVTVESGSTNTTVFVLDYADPLRRPLAELDGNGTLVRRFVWGRGVVAQIEADGTARYFHHDGQGSTLALSDTNNVPTDQWFYSPYGEVMARTGATDTPYQWCGGVGLRPAAGNLYFARHRYYHAGLQRWIARDPLGISGGPNLYTYAMNAPFLYYDPLGLSAWVSAMGALRALGGGLEAAAGYSLAVASGTAAVGTSPTVLGAVGFGALAVGGAAVGAHGVDTFQAGIRQMWTGEPVDSFTSLDLQAAGMSQRAANLTDAGISVVGSLGAGLATAPIRATTIAATDPLAQGLSRSQLLSRWETGSAALNNADFQALGGAGTSPLFKAPYVAQWVDQAGTPLTTTTLEGVGKSIQLLYTGLTPNAALGAGIIGSGIGAANGAANWAGGTTSKGIK